jgi:hypothetical protein
MTQYPKFTVNGVALEERQNIAVWVALQSFGSEMENPLALGDDEHGKTMTQHYLNRVREINKIALTTTP